LIIGLLRLIVNYHTVCRLRPVIKGRSGLSFRPLPSPSRHSPVLPHRQRLPRSDGARAFPHLGVAVDPREQPAQLERGREFAALLERGADGCGFGLGHGEHAGSMGRRTEGRKRRSG
jgi:hypothetical protein